MRFASRFTAAYARFSTLPSCWQPFGAGYEACRKSSGRTPNFLSITLKRCQESQAGRRECWARSRDCSSSRGPWGTDCSSWQLCLSKNCLDFPWCSPSSSLCPVCRLFEGVYRHWRSYFAPSVRSFSSEWVFQQLMASRCFPNLLSFPPLDFLPSLALDLLSFLLNLYPLRCRTRGRRRGNR